MSGTRSFTKRLVATTLAVGTIAVTSAAMAQVAKQSTIAEDPPHMIVVRLIDQPGSKPFAFEPANFTAQRGDTLRFVQASATLHDVHFKTKAKGAKLGGAETSPYLTAKGQIYTLVIDARFTDGTYEIVCEPHETIGMHGFLTVAGTHAAGGGNR